ncbi:MAG: hypothetical protein HZA93_29445 [Verrucomicrobia bacterium]|nr:hypothetical protein [Verrucomicrobiota bacterium]
MNPTEFDRQLRDDIDTLRDIIGAVGRLEGSLRDGRLATRVRRRGYFTPDDEDRTRQLLLAYRNYRLALYAIIHRHEHYAIAPTPDQQIRQLLIGLAAGLTLYSKSLKLVGAYEHQPLVRRKLNEPDEKFGLPTGFFDEVIRAYSSLRNYRAIMTGLRFWRSHLRAIERLRRTDGGDWAWLCDTIRLQRTAMRRRLARVLWCRLRHDWRDLWRKTWRPVRLLRQKLESRVARTVTAEPSTERYRPALDPATLDQLKPHLRPGDVLLIRAEQKLTTALLPGFWPHAAIYLGDRADWESLGLTDGRQSPTTIAALPSEESAQGWVIEAISPRVQLNPLSRSLSADHVAVFRPSLAPGELRTALREAFAHLGKPYDYEFDFNISHRIVCTELIYRSFHRRGGCEFSLVKRLGRYTLTGDDLAGHFLHHGDDDRPAPFELVTAVLRLRSDRAHFFHGGAARHALRRIAEGWRPGRAVPTPVTRREASPLHA